MRRGFTLIELLVAIALIMVVATAAITAVVQMVTMTRRLQALQTMDAAAKTMYERLAVEAGAMHPCTAVWLTSVPGSKSVELVFMHNRRSPRDYSDFRFGASRHSVAPYTDLVWSRWYWSGPTGPLLVSTSRTGRWTRILGDQSRDYWKIPGGSKMSNYYSSFLLVPQPVRTTGTATAPNSPQELLNRNRWLPVPPPPAPPPPEKTDVGDYEDLQLNARPLLFDCSDLSIELCNRDGSTKLADGTASLAWAAPGTYVDGRDHAGLGDRPSQVRIRFTLVDPKTTARRTYSFTCATPSFPHY